jgi:hypothetical protein
LLCSFLHPPVTSSLFGPNILLSTLFSYTPSLCSSLNVRDQDASYNLSSIQLSIQTSRIIINNYNYIIIKFSRSIVKNKYKN